MKKITTLILFCLTFFCSTIAYSETSKVSESDFFSVTNEAGCGIVYNKKASEGAVAIELNNYTICENDLGFTSFYILYGDLLESEFAQSVVNIFVDVPDNIKALNNIAGLGSAILSIFQALSSLIFLFGGAMILYQTGKYMYVTQTSGQFMGKGQKRSLEVAMQGMTAIFLITPVGDILMIQLIILIMAIVGMMIANYFLSSYLYYSSVKSTEVVINDNILMSKSINYSKKLTEINLCEMRTGNLILQNNATPSSPYVEENTVSYAWAGTNEMDDFNRIVHQCHAKYFAHPRESANTYNAISSVEIFNLAEEYCDDQTVNSQIQNEDNAFGYEHSCGIVSFDWPNIQALEELYGSDDDIENGLDFIKKGIRHNKYKNIFGSVILYENFRSKAKTDLLKIMKKDINLDAKNKQLLEQYKTYGVEFYKKFTNVNLLRSENYSNISKQKEKMDLIAATHVIAVNHALGGYFQTGKDYGFEADNDYHYNEDIGLFGFDVMRKGGLQEASINLYKSHCASNWSELIESRQYYKYYESLSDNNKVEPFLSIGKKNFECFIFNKAKGKFDYALDDPLTFSDMDENNNKIITEDVKKTEIKFREEVALKYINDAKLELEITNAYVYAVKYGIMKSLSEKLKKANDVSTIVKVRGYGWAFLGAMMLEVSNGQSNAKKYVQMVENTGNVSTNTKHSGSKSVFRNENAVIGDTNKRLEEDLINMNFGSIFTGLSGVSIEKKMKSVSEDEFEFYSFKYFTDGIKNFIFSPIVYIQLGNNMSTSDSMSESLKKCAENSDCVPSESHPVNTLMMFGHDLLSQAISIYLLGEIAALISKAVDTLDDGGGGGIGVLINKIPFANILTTVIGGLATVIASVIKILHPALFTLIFVGIFCGYLIPTLPYVTFAIVFLGWLINIFVVLFASPVWILLLANLQENGQTKISFNQIWQKTGSILLKPALLTIAMIFAWTLASVSVFFINTTIYPIFETIGDSGFFITNIISIATIYVLYVATIVIAIRHSFGLIAKFGDEFLAMIGVSGTGDMGTVGNMGLERLLVANQMADVVQSGLKSTSSTAKGFFNKSEKLREHMDGKTNDGNNAEDAKNLVAGKDDVKNENSGENKK